VSFDCVVYCAFYNILFRGAVFSRTRCMYQALRSTVNPWAARVILNTWSTMKPNADRARPSQYGATESVARDRHCCVARPTWLPSVHWTQQPWPTYWTTLLQSWEPSSSIHIIRRGSQLTISSVSNTDQSFGLVFSFIFHKSSRWYELSLIRQM